MDPNSDISDVVDNLVSALKDDDEGEGLTAIGGLLKIVLADHRRIANALDELVVEARKV